MALHFVRFGNTAVHFRGEPAILARSRGRPVVGAKQHVYSLTHSFRLYLSGDPRRILLGNVEGSRHLGRWLCSYDQADASRTWEDPSIWRDPALLVQEHGIDEINKQASKALNQQRAGEILNAMIWLSDRYPDEAGLAYHAALALSLVDLDSLKYFDRATAEDPNSFYAQLNKGAALDRLGRINEACQAFRIAHKLDLKLGREIDVRLKSCKD